MTAPTVLAEIEKTIPTAVSTTAAYLSAAEGSATGYEVTATAEPSGDTFTIKNTEGAITHECVTPSKKAAGGCPVSGGSW